MKAHFNHLCTHILHAILNANHDRTSVWTVSEVMVRVEMLEVLDKTHHVRREEK